MRLKRSAWLVAALQPGRTRVHPAARRSGRMQCQVRGCVRRRGEGDRVSARSFPPDGRGGEASELASLSIKQPLSSQRCDRELEHNMQFKEFTAEHAGIAETRPEKRRLRVRQ